MGVSDILILTRGSQVPLLLKSMKQCPWLQQEQSRCQQNRAGARAGERLLSPRARGAVAQVRPSSLCSTTDSPARRYRETTQGRCCFLGAFPTPSGSARAAGVGSCSHHGHSDCVGVFNFIVPTQWRKCNTDTACVLGVRSYTCASNSVILKVTFQLGCLFFF